MTLPRGRSPLLLTMGDPAGIGPEITVAAWRALHEGDVVFAVAGDPALYASDVPVAVIRDLAEAEGVFSGALPVLEIPLNAPVTPGQPDVRNAQAVIDAIAQATRLALSGHAAAIVTNPISKAVLKAAGFPHPGHTEFLGQLCGMAGVEVMMLASPQLRVVPVTVHVSLRQALATLTTELIVETCRTTAEALKRDFGLKSPVIAVAGLNPHAGEEGLMGGEEIEIISPAIDILRKDGLHIKGPMPPDTMFTPAARTTYDAALCMYHDQALIPLKTLDMEHGVNVTLGLPVVRTSPDHGTAFDIAGQGLASPESLVSALKMAAMIGRNRSEAHLRPE